MPSFYKQGIREHTIDRYSAWAKETLSSLVSHERVTGTLNPTLDKFMLDMILRNTYSDPAIISDRRPRNQAHGYLGRTGSGSPDMAVNPGGGGDDWTLGPGAGIFWEVWGLTIWLEDTGTMDPTDFGALANISQPVAVSFTEDFGGGGETDHSIVDLEENHQVAAFFSEGHVPGIVGGFLNTENIFIGSRTWDDPITLDGDNNDVIRTYIQSNLSGLDELQIGIFYSELLP